MNVVSDSLSVIEAKEPSKLWNKEKTGARWALKYYPKGSKSIANGIRRRSPNCTRDCSARPKNKTTTANFLVGELEGAFLKMLVRMTQAKRILEVGMFTGYSALSFAEALPADGSIITCELNPHSIEIARRFIAQSPHAKRSKSERAGRRRH